MGKVERDARTSTSWTREQFESLGEGVWAVDEPLLDQLAAVEACDLFLSPHTGFGCAAVSVGTPLGSRFRAARGTSGSSTASRSTRVLPDTSRYPAFTQMDDQPDTVDDDGVPVRPRWLARASRMTCPSLVGAARALVEKRVTYEEALRSYFPRLLDAYRGDRSKMFSFDGIHWQYI